MDEVNMAKYFLVKYSERDRKLDGDMPVVRAELLVYFSYLLAKNTTIHMRGKKVFYVYPNYPYNPMIEDAFRTGEINEQIDYGDIPDFEVKMVKDWLNAIDEIYSKYTTHELSEKYKATIIGKVLFDKIKFN